MDSVHLRRLPGIGTGLVTAVELLNSKQACGGVTGVGSVGRPLGAAW